MLKLFTNKQPFINIIIVLCIAILWLPVLLNSNYTVHFPFYYLKSPVYNLFLHGINSINSKTVATIFALILTSALSLMIARLNFRYAITNERNYLPGIIFALLICAYIPLQQVNAALFSSFLVLFAIEIIFRFYKNETIFPVVFNAAFILSCASIFYFNAVYLSLIIWIALLLSRPFVWREWAIGLIGFLTPYLLLSSYFYLLEDSWKNLLVFIMETGKSGIGFIKLKDLLTVEYIIHFSILLLMIILSYIAVIKKRKVKIRNRYYFTIFNWIVIISALMFILIRPFSIELIYFIAIPFSYLISNYLLSVKRYWCGEILFSGLLISVIFVIIKFIFY